MTKANLAAYVGGRSGAVDYMKHLEHLDEYYCAVLFKTGVEVGRAVAGGDGGRGLPEPHSLLLREHADAQWCL
jgi:hypothetical protein